ncbi:hypothetical protein LINPERPRIM_LOCUS2566 [Linum perenne]
MCKSSSFKSASRLAILDGAVISTNDGELNMIINEETRCCD